MTEKQAARPDSTPVQHIEITLDPNSPDGQLYEAVRAWRREESARLQLRPFRLFANTTLREIVTLRPGTPEALAQVFGMGPYRCAAFGEPLLGVIVAACERLGLAVASTLPPRVKRVSVARPAELPASAAASQHAA